MEPLENMISDYGIPPLPKEPVEAMAYVPFQPNNATVYNPMEGFEAGTMFPTLNKPFYGSKCGGDKND